MAVHADFLPPTIDDYFRIIDPKSKLSASARSRKMDETLERLPRDFPNALRFVMKLAGTTVDELAFDSHVSASTISRYRNGKAETYSEDKVVALCIAMKLPPWLSRELIDKAGFHLSVTKRQRACMRILDCMYTATVEEVQELLVDYGDAPLKLAA